MVTDTVATRVVPTYSQLEQEVQALREEADFYKRELDDLMRIVQRVQEAPNAKRKNETQ